VLHITTPKTIVANVAKVVKVVKVSKVIHFNVGEDEITCRTMTHTILLKEPRRFDGFFSRF
jgi:hypothetical protein